MIKKCKKLLSLVICAGLIVSGLNSITVSAWSGTDHQAMTTQVTTSTLVKLASSYSDTYYAASADDANKGLHGYQDYVGALKYIYTVAIKIKNSGSAAQTALNNALSSTAFSASTSLTAAQQTRISEAIRGVCAATLNGETATRIHYSDKVLGLAFHLAGDVYAHRTMVPANAVSTGRFNGYSTYFTNWALFSTDVSNGIVQFYQITKYLKVSSTSLFEDNKDFYSSRYSVGTKYLVGKLVENYRTGSSFSKSWFARLGDGSGYGMRLHNFDLYAPWY